MKSQTTQVTIFRLCVEIAATLVTTDPTYISQGTRTRTVGFPKRISPQNELTRTGRTGEGAKCTVPAHISNASRWKFLTIWIIWRPCGMVGNDACAFDVGLLDGLLG